MRQQVVSLFLAGSTPVAHPTWYCVPMRSAALIVAVAATIVVPMPTASAAKAPCQTVGVWTSVWTKDTWRHERCGNTVSVTRGGGELGACSRSYPVGSAYRGPEDDCGYYVNGGPI